jgi:hypothetical protein
MDFYFFVRTIAYSKEKSNRIVIQNNVTTDIISTVTTVLYSVGLITLCSIQCRPY